MMNLKNIGPEKLLLFCGFSLALTLVGFWQFQFHVTEAERLARVHNGVATCFARVTQTFTAAMIKDAASPYLKRDFMALSDECLREGTRSSGITLANYARANKIFEELVSEVYWFHEKVAKVLAAHAGRADAEAPVQAISEKFAKVEESKLDLQDQLDLLGTQYREARLRYEILVAISFFGFVASLLLMGLKEAALLRHRRNVERQALSLLNTGHTMAASLVDQLVTRALQGQGLVVSAQVFADYHSHVLERLALRSIPRVAELPPQAKAPDATAAAPEVEPPVAAAITEDLPAVYAPSEVEVRRMLTAQAVRLKASMEIQEAMVVAETEVLAQVLQALGQRLGAKLHITGKREGERYVIALTAQEVCIPANELEYAAGRTRSVEGVDVNTIIAMDLVKEAGMDVTLRNRINADGKLIGAEAVVGLALGNNRELVTVVRGRKKDLLRAIAPADFN